MSRIRLRGLGIGATVLVVAATSFAAFACGDSAEDSPATPTQANAGGIPANLTTVRVSDNKFSPTNLQIPVGANVTWEWSGSNPHQVTGTFDGQDVLSPKLTGTGVFLFNFPKAGVFEYHCTVHGDAMKGTITIQ